jgi:hypothetical protein
VLALGALGSAFGSIRALEEVHAVVDRSERSIMSLQIIGVGVGAMVAGLLFILGGYVLFGVIALLVGAGIIALGWFSERP